MKIIIFGTGGIAKILYDKFLSINHEIVAFTTEKKYIKHTSFINRPIVEFENLQKIYNPNDNYHFFIAIGGNQLNKLRTRIYNDFLNKGYLPINYIDKTASLAPNVQIGNHVCILENVVAHTNVTIGNNTIIFPNSYLGHHTTIDENCFIAANVSIAGGAKIQKNCFLGASSCIGNSVILGENNVLAMGSCCTKSTDANKIIINNHAFDNAEERFNQYFQRIRFDI